MREEMYARRTARVLLLDGAGRVLLLRYGYPGEWLTPGGGLRDGEPLRDAAVRELREEVGLAIAPDALGPRVAETSGHLAASWINGNCRDDFFLHRVDAHEVDISGLEPHERKSLTGHRWWTPGELAATPEIVYPLDLAPLVADLTAGRVPPEPVRLPWHH